MRTGPRVSGAQNHYCDGFLQVACVVAVVHHYADEIVRWRWRTLVIFCCIRIAATGYAEERTMHRVARRWPWVLNPPPGIGGRVTTEPFNRMCVAVWSHRKCFTLQRLLKCAVTCQMVSTNTEWCDKVPKLLPLRDLCSERPVLYMAGKRLSLSYT